VGAGPGRVWGAQYPFERNHLQRGIALLGLGGVFGVTVILLVHADVRGTVGITLVAAGLVAGLAAASRRRYVTETARGFAVLQTRGGGFVLGSAAAVVVVAVLVVVLVLS
jgi:uncharacterized membrane protein YidH (DUF202 family)